MSIASDAKAIDRRLREAAQRGATPSLLQRAQRRRERGPRRAWIGVAAAAAALLLGVAMWPREPARSVPSCATALADGFLQLSAGCEAQALNDQVEIEARSAAMMRVTGGNLYVELGTVELDVDAPSGPIHVVTKGGVIEVIGTRFVVAQGDRSGHVEMLDGAIRFHALDGTVTLLGAGERLVWPPPRFAARPPAPAATPATPAAPARSDAEASAAQRRPQLETRKPKAKPKPTLADLSALRAQGRYHEALRIAEALLRRTSSRRTRQVIHYEAGTIIQDLIRDASWACRYWNEHRRRYPNGRYAADVDRRRARMGCSEETPE